MRSQIACLNKCKITCICLTFRRCVLSNVSSNRLHESMLVAFDFLHHVFSNVSSLWEYFDLQGPWKKVLTYLKKSLYTIQADPEKSRNFIIKNPGILIDPKSRDSRDPVRAYCWPPRQYSRHHHLYDHHHIQKQLFYHHDDHVHKLWDPEP